MKDQYNGKCRTGALAPTGVRQEKCKEKHEIFVISNKYWIHNANLIILFIYLVER